MPYYDVAVAPMVVTSGVMIALVVVVVAALCALACYLIRRAIRRARERGDGGRGTRFCTLPRALR